MDRDDPPSRSTESLLTRPKIITRPAKDSPWIETTRLQNSSLRVAIGYEGTGNSSIVTGDSWQNLLIVILRIHFDDSVGNRAKGNNGSCQ